MTAAEAVAVAMFAGVILYAVLGGADFGSGLWDLTAGDARRGAKVRSLIDHSIGPVWEANHVWLIFVLVFLWTAFPRPFVAITTTLVVPLALAAVGIVLRGAGFAFRKFAGTIGQARLFGVFFAASSVLTPFFLGTVAGAVASGRVPREGNGNVWTSWTGTTSMIGGVLAVLTCAFLASTFLAADAERGGDDGLAAQLARRAFTTGIATGIVAIAAIAPLERAAPTLGANLQGRALPIVIASAVFGTAALVLLRAQRYALARLAAVAAVTAILVGWGVAQYPWILVDEVTIEGGAGAPATLTALLVVVAIAAIVVVPALVYLLWLTQQEAWAATTQSEHQSSSHRSPDQLPSETADSAPPRR